jgi:hypothetical protein
MWSLVIDAGLPIGISLMKRMPNEKHNTGSVFARTTILLLKSLLLKLINQGGFVNYV